MSLPWLYDRWMPDDLDLSLLPDDLRHLGPLIARYSESDDLARSDLLARLSDDELRTLGDAPSAHWDAINAYLDEHVASRPGPHQDVALALDSFAQAAMEARFELESRGT
jgi:hypothetical protein